MREKLNQFVANLNGQFVEVSDRTNIYQCMDLAYLWVFALGFPKTTIQNLFAYEAFTKPKDVTLQHFDLIPNSPAFIPQDGDIGVFNKTSGNVAGHIVVCLGGGTTSKFKAFSQNLPLGSNASIQDFTYTNFLGVLRPKLPEQAEGFKWLKTLFTENQIDPLNAESRVREMFDQSKKYETAQKERDKALRDLAEAKGDATKFEELHITAVKENRRLLAEIDDLRKLVTDRASQITSLEMRVASLEEQIDPNNVIIVTREEYARLLARDPLRHASYGQLIKTILKKLIGKGGEK